MVSRFLKVPGFLATALEYLEEDIAMEEIFEAFPRITKEDIKACIAYARSLVDTKSRNNQEDHERSLHV